MGYDQGLPPHGASWPQRSNYDPYSYAYAYACHSAAAASYNHQPPPPGTEHAAPAAASSSWSSAAGASNNVVVGGPGANPLAVSALSQPTSFATSIGWSGRDVGHLPYYDPQYPPAQHPTAVGGIGTLMGGGRGGSPMYHPLTWNAGITSPCGRGRGRGNKSSDRQLAIRASGGSSASEAQPETVCAPAHVMQATTTNFTPDTVVPAAWCDICRVGCNSKEILEQHKNGKKHKRTVQRMQDMARLQGMTPAIADMGAPSSTSSQLAQVEGPSTAVHMVPPLGSTNIGGDHKDLAPENVAVQAYQPSDEMKDGGEAPPNAVEARMDVNGNKNGPKRKLTGVGRGGKKLRVCQAPRQRPERVREQPLVCTVCNVTCDTRAVFDIHLGGKKHQSRLKRCPDMLFGPLVVHIPPNQSAAHMTGAPEPI
ncbi:uncharacterized protein [Miscanthus floridulus]|uniref:uncharacterized protein n=1 Tax=Miscanthus floridulus TaxID=154761 RepID=UPI003458E1B2